MADSTTDNRPAGISTLTAVVILMANLWGMTLVGLVVWYAGRRDAPLVPPTPYGLAARLDAAMTPAGDADAADAARLWAAMADAIEADGRATAPRLTTVGQLHDTIRTAGLLAWQPPFSQRYPATVPVLEEALRTLGKAPDPLDRARAAGLLREVGKAFEEAGR